MKPRLSRWLIMLLMLTISSLGGCGAESAKAARWGKNWFPNHEVFTQNGDKIKFYDDAIKGKIVVVNFIYTSCPDLCALSTARLAQVYERLGDRVGKDIFFYSVSLDPHTDRPKVLKEYAEAFGIDRGWFFLTGDPQQVKEIRWKLGERSRKLSEHRSDIVLGNDNTGEWQRMSLMSNLSLVTQRVLEMDPKYRATRHKVAVKSDEELRQRNRISPDQQGSALFLKTCASCHTVGEGKMVGPDLMGVTERRELSWLIDFLVSPDGMRAKKDPIALALEKQYTGVRMPNLRLGRTDAEDLIAYIRAQEALVEKRRAAGETADSGHKHHHGHHGGHGKHEHDSAGEDHEEGHNSHADHEPGKPQ